MLSVFYPAGDRGHFALNVQTIKARYSFFGKRLKLYTPVRFVVFATHTSDWKYVMARAPFIFAANTKIQTKPHRTKTDPNGVNPI